MFFCEPCARLYHWPHSPYKSHGRCEMCGEVAVCNDIPSSALPDPDPAFRVDYEIAEEP